MGRDTIKNVRKALFLLEQIRRTDYQKGCAEVSFQALGADVHLLDVTEPNSKHKGLTIGNFLRQRRMDFVQYDIGLDVDERGMEEFLRRSTRRYLGRGREGRVVGYVFVEGFQTDDGHCFAVPRRDDNTRDERRRLRGKREHLVVDPQGKQGFCVATAGELVDYCRQRVQRGVSMSVLEIMKIRGGRRSERRQRKPK